MSLKLKHCFVYFVPTATIIDILTSYWVFSKIGFEDNHELNKLLVFLANKFGLELTLFAIAALVGALTLLVFRFWEYRLARYYGIFLIITRMLVLPYNFYCAFVIYKILYMGG